MWASNIDSNTSFDGGFDSSGRKDGDERTKQRTQNIFPIMIGHLLSVASIDDITIWDIVPRMYTIIGIVRNVEETATKISYDIQDETGTIAALKWLEADRRASDRTIQIDTYVRVIGLLREQNNKRHVLILKMVPLQKLNELTSHILEVTYILLKAKSMYDKVHPNYDQAESKTMASNEDSYVGNVECGLEPDQKIVYDIIQSRNDTDTGIDRTAVKKQVPPNILSDVDHILDFLVSEGHIYTTCTDDHFKTT